MNYPDGMTKEDWQHINGLEHDDDCPQHEANDGDGDCICSELKYMAYLDAEERKGEVQREIMGGL